jgi:hypothetical protein
MFDKMTSAELTMPFDLAAALADYGRRRRPFWPVPLPRTRERMRRLTLAMEQASWAWPEPFGPAAALAGLKIISTLGAFGDAAACLAESRRRGHYFAGGRCSSDRARRRPSSAPLGSPAAACS